MKLVMVILMLALTGCFNSQKKEANVQAKDGIDGKSGTSCTVVSMVGGATIRCEDGTTSVIKNGESIRGEPGQSIKGDKGDSVVGPSGKSCTVEQTRVGAIIRCENGTSAVISNGAPSPVVQGLPGKNGYTSIIQQIPANKQQCAAGGVLLVSYLDINADNKYTSGVDQNLQQTLLCNQVVECPCKDDHGHHDDKPCDKDR